ncbi:hypothetical protein [Mycobacterium persicum]|nr:hypothetical protein [Mycobacterium persicum]
MSGRANGAIQLEPVSGARVSGLANGAIQLEPVSVVTAMSPNVF